MTEGLNKLKQGIQIILIMAFLIVLALIVSNGRINTAGRSAELAEERAGLAAETAERERVQDEINHMNSDAFFKQILRQQLGMVRLDEIIYIIIYE